MTYSGNSLNSGKPKRKGVGNPELSGIIPVDRNLITYNNIKELDMIIYKATNIINNKCYIGQTTKTLDTRKKQHLYAAEKKNSNFHFHNAIRKYGKENFKWETLEKIKEKEIITERESYWINYYDSYNNGYNSTEKGQQNPMLSEKVIKKHLAAVQSEQFKNKLRIKNTGRRLSKETRKKLSNQKKGIRNPMYGKIPGNAVSVAMLDKDTEKVIKIFKSAAEAGRYLLEKGLTKSQHSNINILNCCRQNKGIKYGYKWKHTESVETIPYGE